MIYVRPNIRILDSELVEDFVRASGPGGQHVNKTASAVQLRFNVLDSQSLPAPVRERLLKLAAARINLKGELVIEAKRYRSQDRNRSDARTRLQRWIERAVEVPKPRKATRPSKAAKQRRINAKKSRGKEKVLRRTPGRQD